MAGIARGAAVARSVFDGAVPASLAPVWRGAVDDIRLTFNVDAPISTITQGPPSRNAMSTVHVEFTGSKGAVDAAALQAKLMVELITGS